MTFEERITAKRNSTEAAKHAQDQALQERVMQFARVLDDRLKSMACTQSYRTLFGKGTPTVTCSTDGFSANLVQPAVGEPTQSVHVQLTADASDSSRMLVRVGFGLRNAGLLGMRFNIENSTTQSVSTPRQAEEFVASAVDGHLDKFGPSPIRMHTTRDYAQAVLDASSAFSDSPSYAATFGDESLGLVEDGVRPLIHLSTERSREDAGYVMSIRIEAQSAMETVAVQLSYGFVGAGLRPPMREEAVFVRSTAQAVEAVAESVASFVAAHAPIADVASPTQRI
jgi:hypothetical protein